MAKVSLRVLVCAGILGLAGCGAHLYDAGNAALAEKLETGIAKLDLAKAIGSAEAEVARLALESEEVERSRQRILRSRAFQRYVNKGYVRYEIKADKQSKDPKENLAKALKKAQKECRPEWGSISVEADKVFCYTDRLWSAVMTSPKVIKRFERRGYGSIETIGSLLERYESIVNARDEFDGARKALTESVKETNHVGWSAPDCLSEAYPAASPNERAYSAILPKGLPDEVGKLLKKGTVPSDPAVEAELAKVEDAEALGKIRKKLSTFGDNRRAFLCRYRGCSAPPANIDGNPDNSYLGACRSLIGKYRLLAGLEESPFDRNEGPLAPWTVDVEKRDAVHTRCGKSSNDLTRQRAKVSVAKVVRNIICEDRKTGESQIEADRFRDELQVEEAKYNEAIKAYSDGKKRSASHLKQLEEAKTKINTLFENAEKVRNLFKRAEVAEKRLKALQAISKALTTGKVEDADIAALGEDGDDTKRVLHIAAAIGSALVELPPLVREAEKPLVSRMLIAQGIAKARVEHATALLELQGKARAKKGRLLKVLIEEAEAYDTAFTNLCGAIDPRPLTAGGKVDHLACAFMLSATRLVDLFGDEASVKTNGERAMKAPGAFVKACKESDPRTPKEQETSPLTFGECLTWLPKGVGETLLGEFKPNLDSHAKIGGFDAVAMFETAHFAGEGEVRATRGSLRAIKRFQVLEHYKHSLRQDELLIKVPVAEIATYHKTGFEKEDVTKLVVQLIELGVLGAILGRTD